MATRSDLLTRLKCAEARWGPTLVGAIIDHFHGPSLLMGRQALRPYRYRRIPVGGHEAVAIETWLSWNGKRVHRESRKHCKRRKT